MTTGTFEKQRAIIYDLVAAGEVQGIVGGLGGIYLNILKTVSRITTHENSRFR